MDNSPTARDRRKRVADENTVERAKRSDAQQIKALRKAGHTATREIARLNARIAKAKEATP